MKNFAKEAIDNHENKKSESHWNICTRKGLQIPEIVRKTQMWEGDACSVSFK